MRSEELANYVSDQIDRLRERIMGVGQEQYEDGDTQLFETMSLDSLFEFAREELDDIVVYACMLKIRLDRLEAALESRAQE